MMDRILKVFTFKSEVYKEVEDDASFTQTAWIIVAIVALLNQIGSNAILVHDPNRSWILSTLVGTVFSVIGFGVFCFASSWAGRQFFNANVTFEEMVRTLGLAYVWNVIGFIGILGLILPLICIVTPLIVIGGIAGFLSAIFAAKEALDLEWTQAIVSILIGWVANIVIIWISPNL